MTAIRVNSQAQNHSLDKYAFKASFFIVCKFVGKTAKEMNSNSVINFAGKGIEQMTWNDIILLYKQGHQIGAHTMNHLQNMTSMPKSELDYEIGHSKQCLARSWDIHNNLCISI